MPSNTITHPETPVSLPILFQKIKTVLKTPIEWQELDRTPDDTNFARQETHKVSPFDKEKLRLKGWENWLAKKWEFRVFLTERNDSVIYIGPKMGEENGPPESWPYIFKLLSPSAPCRILFIASPEKRVLAHINGGYTSPCNPLQIVVYRAEEATRVLIHELLHATCFDSKGLVTSFGNQQVASDIIQLEAKVEAWAEIILCAFVARGRAREFSSIWKRQLNWAEKQSTLVDGPDDYAWRYLAGRLEWFQKWGLGGTTKKNFRNSIELSSFTFTFPELELELGKNWTPVRQALISRPNNNSLLQEN